MKTSESVKNRRAHSALSLGPQDVQKLLKSHELTVSILGLGRIGLPTAALFAHAGALVTGIDIDPRVVDQTNAGECRLVDEPGLEEMVRKSVAEKRLDATTRPEVAIPSSDLIIVCVPTPVEETKSPNYEAVRAASQAVGKSLSRGSIVILESTVGPGVVEDVVGPIIEKESGMKAGTDFGLASWPP